MRSSQQHSFAQIPSANIPRSVFDRSCGYKTTFDAGWLIPFYVDEVVPGDTFAGSLTVFARLSTPIKPIMDNIYIDVHFWAVPYRLVWENWQKFCGERDDPVPEYETDASYAIPQLNIGGTGFAELSIFDYVGLPTLTPNISVSVLPFRAYNLIYNQWYRDQNLIDHADVNLGDSGDYAAEYPLRKRGKRRDYFTSALPWPQKGISVDVPLGTTAAVYGNGRSLGLTDGRVDESGIIVPLGLGHSPSVNYQATIDEGGYNKDLPWSGSLSGVPTSGARIGVLPKINHPDPVYGAGLYADLEDATAATINQLRQAFQLQKFFERDARGGTRYIEIIRSHFNVVSPDFRLQRAEFLGGGTIPVNINPVQQTGPTAAGQTPQGNLAGFGVAAKSGISFSKSFVEHCILIGIVSARCDMTYSQGINRMWTRYTREEFYWPTFAHLGEQPVYNYEIHATGTSTDLDVFGYQERYAEYRYKPSLITGAFRHSYTGGTLDYWHLSQVLDTTFPAAGDAPPLLNEDFVAENPPIDRVIAVPSEPHFIFDSHLSLHCARPMPVYSVPGLIDHF